MQRQVFADTTLSHYQPYRRRHQRYTFARGRRKQCHPAAHICLSDDL